MIKFTNFIKDFTEGKQSKIKFKFHMSTKFLDLNKIKIKNAEVEAYEYSFDENGTKLYAISYFILLKGNLLIANFYSISKKEIEKILEYFYSIEKIN